MAKPSAIASLGLTAVVLAAGGSSRLGRPKQLLRHGGEPLIARAARLAQRAAGGRVIVVLGAERLRLQSSLRRRGHAVYVAYNARWRDGLAGSLRTGLACVPASAKAALVLLTDQALLDAADLERLVAHWLRRPDRPAAACYDGDAGAPAIIPRRLFRHVRRLDGDIGARHLLRELPGLTLVGMPAAGFDVDTPADAAALRALPYPRPLRQSSSAGAGRPSPESHS